jgi:homospermidine synthase
MPADPSAWSIFVDEDLAESVLRAVEQQSDLTSQREQKRREWSRLNNRAAVVVIAVAETHHLAIRKIAVEVEGFERKEGELASERLHLFAGEDAQAIAKSFGQPQGDVEKIGLLDE